METKPLLSVNTDEQPPPKSGFLATIRTYKLSRATLLLAVYVVLYVVFGVVNSLFLKKTMNAFTNYPFFMSQVTNYSYIPIFGAVVIIELLFTKLITKEQRIFPWWKFLVMGALDAVNGYFVVIGGVKTSGPMQQLLNQAIIPVTMISTFLFMKERYSLLQIGGALIIVGGVIVALVPALTGKGNTGNVLFWNIFFLAQAIPFAASNIYKDIAFKEVEMDVWYLQFWDVFWQSLFGTMLFPINTILPPPATIHWSDISPAMKNGGMCMIGQNVIVNNCTKAAVTLSDVQCDNCHNAWLVLIIYMAINVTYNVFILLVIKHGSATILSIAQTVRLPLTNLFFSFKFIMGEDATPFSPWSVGGLFVILAGLGLYRYASLRKAKAAGAGTVVRVIPHVGAGATEIMVESAVKPQLLPKTNEKLREQYFTRLGIGMNYGPNK